MKGVKVEIFRNTDIMKLEKYINKFLDENVDSDNLIDMKYSISGEYVSCMIIYKIDKTIENG